MGKEIYSVKATKYGTPTGTATMPVTLTALPDNVKGTITLDESDATYEKKFAEQKNAPVRIIKTAEGEPKWTADYYEIDYDTLADLKGGDAVTPAVGTKGSYTPGTEFTVTNKAFQVETDSGHVFKYFNAIIDAKIKGAGGREGHIALSLAIMPQLCADGSAGWMIEDAAAPTA